MFISCTEIGGWESAVRMLYISGFLLTAVELHFSTLRIISAAHILSILPLVHSLYSHSSLCSHSRCFSITSPRRLSSLLLWYPSQPLTSLARCPSTLLSVLPSAKQDMPQHRHTVLRGTTVPYHVELVTSNVLLQTVIFTATTPPFNKVAALMAPETAAMKVISAPVTLPEAPGAALM